MEQIVNNSQASQNKFELLGLLNEVNKIKPKVIVEIGTWMGYSADTFIRAFNPELLITVDTIDQGHSHNFVLGKSQDKETFDKVRKKLNGRKIDFLFIDGGHFYLDVRDDFRIYSTLVKDGGIIALHDVCLIENPGVEVYRLWQEISQQYKSICYWDKPNNGTGTGILWQ